jgi:hypothetical protein
VFQHFLKKKKRKKSERKNKKMPRRRRRQLPTDRERTAINTDLNTPFHFFLI